MLPSSSRVKKVLKWDYEEKVFTMDPSHLAELRAQQIPEEAQWAEFEGFFRSLPPKDHPS